MAEREKYQWTGATGTEYTYFIYTRSEAERLDSGHKGNYILAKKVVHRLRPWMQPVTYWKAIYIGQGDLGDRARDHKDSGCINDAGSTHFHCHVRNGSSKKARTDEEADLTKEHSPPCEGKGDD